MVSKRINRISDIKTLEELKEFKVRKRHEVELKKLEVQASLIRVQMNLDPERIKQTIIQEANNYLQNIALQYVPDFLLKFFTNK